MRDEIALDLLGVHEVGHAEARRHLLLVGIEIDADDLVRAGEPQPLDHVEPDAAETEDDRPAADLGPGGVDHRADAGGHAAADVADLVEGGVLVNLCQRNLRQDRVIGEGGTAHVVMQDGAVVEAEARGAVGHHALALRGADRLAEIGLAREAVFAFAAFGGVERDHVVAGHDALHALADLEHDARALVAEDRGERAPRDPRPTG